MKFETHLKNKNLAKGTIRIYLIYSNKWLIYLGERKPTKSLFIKFISYYLDNKKPNTTKLVMASVSALLRFQKKWKLYNEFRDIRLPSQDQVNRTIITFEDFKIIEENMKRDSWFDRRNFIIFSFLFMTGIRANELVQLDSSKIVNNKIMIKCKGSFFRTIYIPEKLLIILKDNSRKYICTTFKNKKLSNCQLIKIIRNIGIIYLNKKITPHSLRRSYATNLIRSKVEISVVAKLMGHKNITTTSRYIYLSEDEIFDKVKTIF